MAFLKKIRLHKKSRFKSTNILELVMRVPYYPNTVTNINQYTKLKISDDRNWIRPDTVV